MSELGKWTEIDWKKVFGKLEGEADNEASGNHALKLQDLRTAFNAFREAFQESEKVFTKESAVAVLQAYVDALGITATVRLVQETPLTSGKHHLGYFPIYQGSQRVGEAAVSITILDALTNEYEIFVQDPESVRQVNN